MPDITHDLVVAATPREVFNGIAAPEGLDRWWTLESTGTPAVDADYLLDFGEAYQWKARVVRYLPTQAFELELIEADPDWVGTRVSLELDPAPEGTRVRFRHTGWRHANEHYRISCYCWAMYLRILKRWLEHQETVPYEHRLEA